MTPLENFTDEKKRASRTYSRENLNLVCFWSRNTLAVKWFALRRYVKYIPVKTGPRHVRMDRKNISDESVYWLRRRAHHERRTIIG